MPSLPGPESGPRIIQADIPNTEVPSLESLAIAQAVCMREQVSPQRAILFSFQGQVLDAGSYLAVGIERFRTK